MPSLQTINAGLTPARLPVVEGAAFPAAPLPQVLSPMPNAMMLLRALQRRWLLALTTGLFCGLLASAIAWLALPPAKYTARSLIQVDSVPQSIMGGSLDPKIEYFMYQRTQTALIKSRLVLVAALREPGISDYEIIRGLPDPVDWLDQQLNIESPLGSELLVIRLSGDNAKETAGLVDAVTNAYMREIVLSESKGRQTRQARLKKIYDAKMSELNQRRRVIRELSEKVGAGEMTGVAANQKITYELLGPAQNELGAITRDLLHANSELELEEDRAKDLANVAVSQADVDKFLSLEPEIVRLLERIKKLKDLVASDRIFNTPNQQRHKELADAETELKAKKDAKRPDVERELRTKAGSAAQDRVQQLRWEISKKERYKKVVKEQVDRLKDAAEAIRIGGVDLETVRAEIAPLEAVTLKAGTEIEALKIEADAPGRIRVIDNANVPQAKDDKKQLRMIQLAGGGTFALVLLAIAFREFRARRVDTVEEVVNGLGMRLVGSLPALPDRGWRRLVGAPDVSDGYWRNRFTESVDATRTMLLHMARLDSVRIVMVTSAMGGEGKTSLSCHLAGSLARAGKRTLLVDCDLRNPSAHRLLDLPVEPGFSEVLRGETHVAEATRSTAVNGLWTIPAGRCDAAALQALALDNLPSIFQQLREQYDFVIVDSCPVLPVTDSLLLGQHVDGVVFSILRDVSRLPEVYAAYQRLATLGIRMLGAIVNGTQNENHAGAYHYLQPAPE